MAKIYYHTGSLDPVIRKKIDNAFEVLGVSTKVYDLLYNDFYYYTTKEKDYPNCIAKSDPLASLLVEYGEELKLEKYLYKKDDLVVCRTDEYSIWRLDIYVGYNTVKNQHITKTMNIKECLPFNEETINLVGTTYPSDYFNEQTEKVD